MRAKTYFTPKRQVDETCDYAWYSRLFEIGNAGHVGQIVRPHRLFLPGDIVFVRINNGQASRYPVYSVTSKGYTVSGYYTYFASFWHEWEVPPRNRVFDFVEIPAQFATNGGYVPRHSLIDPDFRRWLITVVEAGRARFVSAQGVSADSPQQKACT